MRLFIAINFNEEIKNSLCNIIERLKNYAVKGNFTGRENLHLTIVFLGETPKADVVKEAMNSIKAASFRMDIGGFGLFFRQGGDICWVGVDKNNALFSIYNQLCTTLTKVGFTIEKRVFKPHVTLGREVILNRDLNINTFAKTIVPMNLEVTKISLMKSERIGSKLTYTEIYAKELV